MNISAVGHFIEHLTWDEIFWRIAQGVVALLPIESYRAGMAAESAVMRRRASP